MMSRVEGSICGVQSVLISTTLHVLILTIFALNSGSRMEHYDGVRYFQLVFLETEQQESSDIVELEPNLTSAKTKELGALEPDLSSVLEALPIVANELLPYEKPPLSRSSYTSDGLVEDDQAPDDLNQKDFTASAPRDEHRSFINYHESAIAPITGGTSQTSAPKIQPKSEKTGYTSSASNTLIEREIRQFIEVNDQSTEADVPADEPKIEFSHNSKLEFSNEERSTIFMAAGSQPISADLAKQAMKKLFREKSSRFEGPQSLMADAGACKTGNNTAFDRLPNADVVSVKNMIGGNKKIRISDLLGEAKFGFSNNSGMTINHLLNNFGQKNLYQKPPEAITISWLLNQQKISKVLKCE